VETRAPPEVLERPLPDDGEPSGPNSRLAALGRVDVAGKAALPVADPTADRTSGITPSMSLYPPVRPPPLIRRSNACGES
jgi:hypothetical protein